MAASGDTRVCVQVTENMTEPATIGRELKPLRAIRDAHPKAVMAMRGDTRPRSTASRFSVPRTSCCIAGGIA